MPSYVTDRPAPSTTNLTPEPSVGCSTSLASPSPSGHIDQHSLSRMSHVSTSGEAIAGTSSITRSFPSTEDVRPFEKAGPRKGTNKGRKKRQSAILTDTPVKEALRSEQEKAKKKKLDISKNRKEKITKRLFNAKTNCAKKESQKPKEDSYESDENEDEDCACIYCLKRFKHSKPGAEWIQCTQCERWAHDKCRPNDSNSLSFICVNCDSDFDSS